MKKIILFVTIFFLSLVSVHGQSLEELQVINNKSKSPFTKPEMLDQLMIALRKYSINSLKNEDTLLLETYRNISSAYMANNHFKQAYEVYINYIKRKEEMLLADKKTYLTNTVFSVTSRQQKDLKEENELKTTLKQLKEDNENLASKRLSFKSNFSLLLIILTSIFAIMLVIAGIRKMSLRSKLQQNRDRMKSIHRLAVIGNFSIGLGTSIKYVIKTSQEQTLSLHQNLKKQDQNYPPVRQAVQIIAEIEKIYMKIAVLITFFLFLNLSSFCETCQLQTNSKTFQIHKTMRPFVNKIDRPYLKKKVQEIPVQKQSGNRKKIKE